MKLPRRWGLPWRRKPGPRLLVASTWFRIEYWPERPPSLQVEVVFENGSAGVRLSRGDAGELGHGLITAADLLRATS